MSPQESTPPPRVRGDAELGHLFAAAAILVAVEVSRGEIPPGVAAYAETLAEAHKANARAVGSDRHRCECGRPKNPRLGSCCTGCPARPASHPRFELPKDQWPGPAWHHTGTCNQRAGVPA